MKVERYARDMVSPDIERCPVILARPYRFGGRGFVEVIAVSFGRCCWLLLYECGD